MDYNFLIMDDSPIIRQVLTKCLQMSGVPIGEVFSAANGIEGMAILDHRQVHMVFADLNMPSMSGKEVIQKLAANRMISQIPVVVISSERNAQLRAELLELGVREFVDKPFTPEQMKSVVTAILDS